jgi:hypothetical protein
MKKHWILLIAVVLLLIGALVVITQGNEISIGNLNFDYFSSGPYAMGIFSAGIFSVGIFSIGIFNVGLYALGIFVLAWKKKLPSFFDKDQK